MVRYVYVFRSGKEAALFVPSGTFGNQLALLTWCERGGEVILGDQCHIIAHEAGAGSVIAGVQFRTIDGINGLLPTEAIEAKIRKVDDIHEPKTNLICLENALANGCVLSLDYMSEAYSIANKHSIPLHLDGARIFNAAVALEVTPSEIAKYTDSVMFCLSKGLCAPVGSILAGGKPFIAKARRLRKLMGGGLRQAGVLAAPGIIAIEKMSLRLKEDHDNAKLLGELLSEIPGINVLTENIHINMVYFDILETGLSDAFFEKEILKRDILINGADNGIFRFVTHYWIDKDNINHVVSTIKEIINGGK